LLHPHGREHGSLIVLLANALNESGTTPVSEISKLGSQKLKHFYISICLKGQKHTDGVQSLMLFICSPKSIYPKEQQHPYGVQSLMLFT
jgi:hypothetical protein